MTTKTLNTVCSADTLRQIQNFDVSNPYVQCFATENLFEEPPKISISPEQIAANNIWFNRVDACPGNLNKAAAYYDINLILGTTTCNTSDKSKINGIGVQTSSKNTRIYDVIFPETPTDVTVSCEVGDIYSGISDKGIITCKRNVTDIVTVSCDEGSSVTSVEQGVGVCTPNQTFTSHIYESKSRKGRNIENFSQNINKKCKVRY